MVKGAMRHVRPALSKNNTNANLVTPNAKRVHKRAEYNAHRVTEATLLSPSWTETHALKSVPSVNLEIERLLSVKSAPIHVKRAKIVRTFV